MCTTAYVNAPESHYVIKRVDCFRKFRQLRISIERKQRLLWRQSASPCAEFCVENRFAFELEMWKFSREANPCSE